MYAFELNIVNSQEQIDELFHLPDRRFFDWCAKSYSINKGIFNVIDSWLFDYGLKDIVSRRKAMDQYLNYLLLHGFYNEKKLYLQFGKKGVTESLSDFAAQHLSIMHCAGDYVEA
ncbi:RNA-binding protein [Sporosarcina sp. PTS2304]|uniref:RNA-binding protein n=1 Tax=Sporosarcina sp. PTS2304 TaxID=2283194 RepID=UPI000E0CF16B|nr:RNA-binding protein [Sporosarcina sp. PTS2304]AXI00232.1 RNA-binding protein [Sporosarcina sp. PTS2304]